MSDDAPVSLKTSDGLQPIDFQSPGRFAVNNPDRVVSIVESDSTVQFLPRQSIEPQQFRLPTEARIHALALIQQARHSISIHSPDLEPWLYNHSSVQQACSHFLRSHPRNTLRILIHNPARAIREGHLLLALGRRLSSNLHIRRANPDYAGDSGACLIIDDCGLLLRPEVDQFSGYALYQNPGRARARQRQFERCWEHGFSDPDLRSFLL